MANDHGVRVALLLDATGLTEISQGLRFAFMDETDPRWDTELEKCVGKALGDSLPERDGGQLPNQEADEAPVVEDAAVERCQDAAKLRADQRLWDERGGLVDCHHGATRSGRQRQLWQVFRVIFGPHPPG